MYRTIVKPFFDRLAALAGLVVFSPLLVLVAISLAVFNKGNVWFIQRRPGYQERIFNLIKFRTMTEDRDGSGTLLPDKQRLMGIGKFIRRTSIDELPQLINVLRGEMSLVGPRPLLAEYLPLYNELQRRRHLVKPGITGWAQVNGRNAISWEQKFTYDLWYVDRQSFTLDIKILLLTMVKIFSAKGITSATSVTMEPFHGNE